MAGGTLAGIITERDYARKVILLGRNSRDTLVRDVMEDPVLFVTPHQSIDECMRLMTDRRIRHLPVLEGGRLTGIVSMGDLVNWVIESHEQTIHQLQSYINGVYPA